MKKHFTLTMALFLVLLSGCATNSMIEVVNPDALGDDIKVASLEVKNATGQVFDIDIESMLEEGLLAELDEQNIFDKTEGVFNLSVSIIQYEKGSAMARWIMPGMGATILSVEASLINTDGVTVAQSQATKSIGAGGGYTIGAWKTVFQDISKILVADLISLN